MEQDLKCPSCGSSRLKLNGHIHTGKQNHQCKECGRQFVKNPEKKLISDQEKEQINRLLLEKISLAGISRAMKVSEVWLQGYISELYACSPDDLNATLPDQASMEAHLEDKFDALIYTIAPLKKMLERMSLERYGKILIHLRRS